MITFLAVIHIIACLGLIGLVLIQDSKGGGIFTSQSSNSVLGAGGATSLAQTTTKAMALLFAATCIGLSIMSARSEKSVVDSILPAAASIPTSTQATPAKTEPSAATAPAATATPAANEKK